jgi:thioredoxin reductase
MIETVRQVNDGIFEALDACGTTWKGKSLILATGVIDVPIDIPGFIDCWGIRM